MNRFCFAGVSWLPALLLATCNPLSWQGEEVVPLEVAGRTVECVGEAPQRCLLVRRPGEEEWSRFFGAIEGFAYEEGYRYRLDVVRQRVRNPPADGSSFRYRLRRVLSRTPDPSG